MEFIRGEIKYWWEVAVGIDCLSHRVEDVTTSFQGIFIASGFPSERCLVPKQSNKKGVENACGCFTQDP